MKGSDDRCVVRGFPARVVAVSKMDGFLIVMLHNVLGQLEFLLRVIFGEDPFGCQSDHSIKLLS